MIVQFCTLMMILVTRKYYSKPAGLRIMSVWYCNLLFDVVYLILQYCMILVDIVIVNCCVPAGTAWLGCAILVMALHVRLMLRKVIFAPIFARHSFVRFKTHSKRVYLQQGAAPRPVILGWQTGRSFSSFCIVLAVKWCLVQDTLLCQLVQHQEQSQELQ